MNQEHDHKNLNQQICPYCGKELASEEFEKAKNKMEKEIRKKFTEQNEIDAKKYRDKIAELEKQKDDDLKNEKEKFEIKLEQIKNELHQNNQEDLEMVKKQYEEFKQEKINHFEQLKQENELHQKQLLDEKDKKIQELQNQHENVKKLAYENAEIEYSGEIERLKQQISEKEILITRTQKELEDAKNGLTQSPSELKGEVGERDLRDLLMSEFPEDIFKRQSRGVSEADIEQRIRSTSGILDTKIIYDNKNAKTITTTDIQKAKKYREIHGTKYVFIVGTNLPKYIKNGLIGQKDGVLIVHQKLILELARTTREAIIEISKLTKSDEYRITKEGRLYEYILSPEFASKMQSLSDLDMKFIKIQVKEEKDHEKLWKTRKSLHDEMLKCHNKLSGEIASITQTDLISTKIKSKLHKK